MGEQAVALSKAVGYDSAGTVEFVAGQDKSFFFLEMNTRLQVEHPVTELVTGIDLVEQMIRVAAGEKLKLKQADVKLNGWAVESRIYAEDPFRNFLPSIGRLTRYRPPAEGKTPSGGIVRNDTGVFEGAEISMHYDPMIAKLVTHAATREAAIDLQSNALDAFVIDGVEHNIPFLAALMQHPRWREGRLSTGFIAEEYKGGFKPPVPQGEVLDILAAVAVAIDHLSNARRRQITDQMSGPPVRFSDRRFASVGGTLIATRVEGTLGNPTKVTFVDAKGIRRTTLDVDADWWPGQPVWTGMVHGKPRVGAGARHPQWLRPRLSRHPHQGLRLHRAGGSAGRVDAREGRARYLQAAAVPDAGAGQGHPRRRRTGGEGRRGAVRGRGHEDGEHPEGRARRQGQGGQGQDRRQPCRGRRHHGVRVTADLWE